MATKAHTRNRRSRQHSRRSALRGALLMLAARTLASLVVMVVAHWLHMPSCAE